MSKWSLVLPAIAAAVLPGCMSTPPLSKATGAEDSKIFIKDVVQRVKCELSDAFDEKTAQPEFIWLAGWTAHVDLSLAINDNAGISPNGSFTSYRPNAVNTDAGLITNTATVVGHAPTYGYGLVSQFFSVSAGANYSGQAVRTETVSFTLALDELKAWRRDVERRDAGRPPEQRTCFPKSTGLTGNLGLKEWVDSAFYPVELREGRDLHAGVYKADWKQFKIPPIGHEPFNGYKYLKEALNASLASSRSLAAAPELELRNRGVAAPRNATPPQSICKAGEWEIKSDEGSVDGFRVLSQHDKIDQVAQWQRQLKSLQTATSGAISTIASNVQKINSNIITVTTRLDDNKKYEETVSPHIKSRYDETRRKVKQILDYVESCSDYKSTLESAEALSDLILPSLYQVGTSENQDNWCNPKYYCAKAKFATDPAMGCSAEEISRAEALDQRDPRNEKKDSPYGFCRVDACPNIGTNVAYANLKSLMQKLQTRAADGANPKKDAKASSFEQGALVCSENLTWLAENVNVFVSDLPNQVDPPLDSVLHSLQFVISYGANVTPSWTLLQWRGPGQNGNFLSASGVQTHTLQLALGPRTGQAAITPDATRLIQNQTVRSLGN